MISNTFGKAFKITTFGESHGKAVGVVIDGVKPGLGLSEEIVQKELDRRRPGYSELTSARKESDKAEILSGVFEGKTIGTPICIIVKNRDAKPEEYEKLKNVFRPSHADFTFLKKYGIRDYRGGGRASARETVARVAAGAIAKEILKQKGIKITGFVKEVMGQTENMEKIILKAKEEGDSVGGIVEIRAENVPPGLGDPVFEKLDANLAKALMSIGAVKGVEIGAGFKLARMKGSQANDEFLTGGKTKTNNSGGIQGGISNGMPIVARIAVKPTSSIAKEQETVDVHGNKVKLSIKGRHDPCICQRIVPVAEAMVALVLIDHLMVQEGIKGDKESIENLRNQIDMIDANLLDLIAERKEVVKRIRDIKKAEGMQVKDVKREKEVLEKRRQLAKKLDLDEKLISEIFKKLMDYSKKVQKLKK